MMLPQFLDNPFVIKLSFHKVIEKFEGLAATGNGSAAKNARIILKEVSKCPELKDGITDMSQLLDNAALISRLVSGLFPAELSNNEIKAITIPYQGLMFNYTQRFQDILNDAGPDFEINIRDFNSDQFYIFTCGIILSRFYGANLDFNKPLFYDIPARNGIIKYYRILYNANFMDIFPAGKAPELSDPEIRQLLDNYDHVSLWKEKFPPGSWIMKGFSMMTLINVTIENSVSLLKDSLLNQTSGADLRRKLSSVFRSIFQINDIDVGLTLYHQASGKISTMGLGQMLNSFLLPGKEEENYKHLIVGQLYDVLVKKQRYFTVADVDEFLTANPGNELMEILKNQGIKSFILAPVIKNEIPLGFIEVISFGEGEFNSVNATKLDLVMPYLTDAIDHNINEFQNRLRAVIQNNYTSMHPSVNWKFEREAKNYLKCQITESAYSVKEIRFRKVFALYGQVDVRNSSATRNLSVKSDLENQLSRLIPILQKIDQGKQTQTREQHLLALKAFQEEIAEGVKANTEQMINHYLDLSVYPSLNAVDESDPAVAKEVQEYFLETDNLNGFFYANRRNYEKTMVLVNDKLVGIMDKRQLEIQAYYPHYYERFKTDGVEHNLYIGNAISPDRELNDKELRRLRLWQLLVTAEMELAQFQLKSILPYHLGVTTLILVFTTSIDIRFRMDEKRFDIDGAYNIRYEVIKKRIDKAMIKGTNERITHRGQLTIVYSKKEEETEYSEYLLMLQESGIIEHKIEKIEVEDLQGVSGLKALRASFRHDEQLLLHYDLLYEELYRKLN